MPILATSTGKRLAFPGIFLTIKGDGYVSPPRVLEPETLAHVARVDAAGGSYLDVNAVDDAYKFIKERNLLTNISPLPRLQVCLDARFGVLLDAVSGRVNKWFSLMGAAHDANLLTATAGVQGPEYLPTAMVGKPTLLFNNAGLVTPPVACTTAQFAHCALGQLPSPSQNGAFIYSHTGPAISNAVIYVDGFLRGLYDYDYAGWQVYIANTSGNGYQGVPARTVMRFTTSRPTQLLAAGNGLFSSVYATATVRPAPNYTAPVGLGFRSTPTGAVSSHSTNTRLSVLWMLDRDDGPLMEELDAFVKLQYGMSA